MNGKNPKKILILILKIPFSDKQNAFQKDTKSDSRMDVFSTRFRSIEKRIRSWCVYSQLTFRS
jgi:hypothetical protein